MPESAWLVGAIALSISALFGLANHVQHIALQYMDVRSGTIVIVATALGILLLLSPAYFDPTTIWSPAVGLFALAGLIVPAVSMSLHTWAVRLIGPSITSALTSTSPMFAILLALTLLGESGGLQLYVGTGLIIGSIATMALRSRRLKASWPLWALLVALGAGLCRAVSHNVIKLGLIDLPSPLTAALVGSVVSLLVLGAVHGASGRTLPSWNRGYWWFGIAGILNGVGLVGLNLALHLGSVTLVSPLISTTPVFTLLLGWLFFRREVIGWQTVVAIGVIFAGCLLIILR